ncbi:MAG: hypothetical protein IJX85_05420, partial [Lachnospiraceae bacterium]|nr:hypothetical protein [Lachnospiraceae bacterium]
SGAPIDTSGFTVTTMTEDDVADYYNVGPDDIHVIEETGELIFGENVYNTLKTADKIDVSYAKTQFLSGDLRPEHYFDCTQYTVQTDGSVKEVEYERPEDGQAIYYEVNFNQSLQVNTEGNQVISEEMSNDINDLIYALTDLSEAEDAKIRLTKMLEDVQYSSDDAAVEQINRMINDLDTEIAIKKENMQKTFSNNITNFQTYMSVVSAMQSDIGSRMSKLEMISTRVDEQFAAFKELKSQNEDTETDAAIIDFNEAELVYESALAATSNIMQTTLLDYL